MGIHKNKDINRLIHKNTLLLIALKQSLYDWTAIFISSLYKPLAWMINLKLSNEKNIGLIQLITETYCDHDDLHPVPQNGFKEKTPLTEGRIFRP